MPLRKIAFRNKYFYHIYNRGIEHRPTFTSKKELKKAQQTLWFYQFQNLHVRLSRFNELKPDQKLAVISKQKPQIKIISYALLGNHYHVLVQQTCKGGVSQFISNFQNSYTKYFNFFHKRSGNLFQIQFKAKLVETDEQLIHINRYIHLNPYKHAIVKKFNQLSAYPWSSYPEYLNRRVETPFVHKKPILSHFQSISDYETFVQNRANYQKLLDKINHLSLE